VLQSKIEDKGQHPKKSPVQKETMQGTYDPNKYSNKRLRANLHQQALNVASALGETMRTCSVGVEGEPVREEGTSLEWRRLPTAGWASNGTLTEHPLGKVYPFDKTGYASQNPGPPPTQAKSFAEAVEKSRQECKTCQIAQPDLVPLGCSLVTPDGEDMSVHGRQLVHDWRRPPGYNSPPQGQNPVFVTEPNRKTKQGDNANLTPLFSHYDSDLYKTPLDRTENMISTGVMVNPWTGRMYETFEKQLPPPTTNKYAIDPDQLKRTNPQLVWLNGGIDPNAPPPSKREVCVDIPGPDGGPNVWGQQMYTEQVGRRIKEYVESQVFNNRNGDYSCEPGFPKEKPAGMVGVVNALRAIPYLPPTQRSSIDINGYMGQADGVAGVTGMGQNPIEEHGLVETRKIDLTSTCGDRAFEPDGFSGQYAAPVVPIIDPKPTWRGRTDGWMTGPVTGNSTDPNMGGYVLLDPTVRDTLKGLNEQQFPTMASMTPVQDTGGYVVSSVTVRDTLKGLNEQQFRTAALTQQINDMGGHVLIDPTVRQTLKGLNEIQYPIVVAAPTETIPSVGLSVIDPTVRDTLKGLNEQQFPTVVASPLESMPSSAMSVVDPTVRDTLKGLNEQQFPTVVYSPLESMPATMAGVTDPTVRDTLKGLNELQLRTNNPGIDYGQLSGHVVIDPTVRDTLKGLNELQLQTGMASEQYLGDGLPFQGDLRIGARRSDYSTDTRPGDTFFGADLTGPNIGPAQSTSKQNRGQEEFYWVEPSQIVAEVGDTAVRWIGQQTRDTRRQMGPNTPGADFTQDNGVFLSVDRMYPMSFPSCRRPDSIDDEWQSMRPDHFRSGVIFGD